jgi:glutamate/tyrosine decarboxylase-like PLP-dependent enzyme
MIVKAHSGFSCVAIIQLDYICLFRTKDTKRVMKNFDFDAKTRSEAWDYLLGELEDYYSDTASLSVSPTLNPEKIKEYAREHSLKSPLEVNEAIDHVMQGLKKFAVHTPHPQYFGLFNPRPAFPGILADTIAATLNPQLAAWSHAPFAAEVENRLIQEIGEKFGYPQSTIDGTFTTGGTEANLTGVLCALNEAFPEFANKGLRSIDKNPVIYVSAESHHSLVRAASVTGLGMDAVRAIPVNDRLQIRTGLLEKQIEEDLANNFFPLMITATMGTTGTGAIDDITTLAEISSKHNLWLHADAAYGGAVALSNRYKKLIRDIHLADSITFDAHKWISVPMGAGMYITKHPDILSRTFRIAADYMPKEAGELQIVDPFTHSIQWSRRFIGLKVYLSLLMLGWEAYEQIVERQIKIGKLLKAELQKYGWFIFNHTDLPIVCFGKESFKENPDAAIKLNNKILASGGAWLSVYNINGINTLRACITNYATDEDNISELVEILQQV